MIVQKKILLLVFFSAALAAPLKAGPGARLKRGFEALGMYDYFRARKHFADIHYKRPHAAAAYGLATIYLRNDNPFHSLDSAARFVNISFNTFRLQRNDLLNHRYGVDSASILDLADSVAHKSVQKVKKAASVESCNRFLLQNYLCRRKYIYEVIYLRDELEFNDVMNAYHSAVTREFILTHPQSIFVKEANILLERQIFDEITRKGRPQDYISFLSLHPRNVMVNKAYEKLFEIYRKQSDVSGLKHFVHTYPRAPQNLEAWKLLFSLTVKTYSYSELRKFIEDYPEFPLKNSILKDLELNKVELFAVEDDDYTGYIDSRGEWFIKPAYDGGTSFSEGLAVVSRNDSVFYINKENVNPFRKVFSEAYPFRNGIAAVKQAGRWYFINRQAQIISSPFDEINELSGEIYVVKTGDRYGAYDQYGEKILDPQFQKLGDFKNGYAYYVDNNRYGFVSRSGNTSKAEFEWISDFDARGIALYKQNGKFGLVTAKGRKILDPLYDQLIGAGEGIFIAVSQNQYGFFSDEGCFVTQLIYDYRKEFPADHYAQRGLFKLLLKGEVALADANGKIIIPFRLYDDLGFPSSGRIRAGKRGKYGYLDTLTMSPVIGFKYNDASDFTGGLAIVSAKDRSAIIDHNGAEIFSASAVIKRINDGYFFLEDEEGTVINGRGELIQKGVGSYEVKENTLLLRLKTGDFKLINK